MAAKVAAVPDTRHPLPCRTEEYPTLSTAAGRPDIAGINPTT